VSAPEPPSDRAGSAGLAEQRASLRRLTALVVGGAPSADVFAAVAREVADALHPRLVQIWRDGTATVMGTWGERPNPFAVGSNWPWDEPAVATIATQMRDGSPLRVDDLGEVRGAVPDAGREVGVASAAGAGIMVGGEPWGLIGVGMAHGAPLPGGFEDRLVGLTGLVATAISNSATREQVARLAAEQAALLRVATIVARGAPPNEVFDAVAEELGRLLDVGSSGLVRFEDDRSARVVANRGRLHEIAPIGTRLPIGGTNVLTRIARTGRSARMDDVTRGGRGRIADEQAALRRVATLVAEEAPAGELFAKVAEEVAGVFGQRIDTAIFRYGEDETATVVAVWGEQPPGGIRVGARTPIDGSGVTAKVHRERRPVRVDDCAGAQGVIAGHARTQGSSPRSAARSSSRAGCGVPWSSPTTSPSRFRPAPSGGSRSSRSSSPPRSPTRRHGPSSSAWRPSRRRFAGWRRSSPRPPRPPRCSTR
jgi:GAF domain-containing protein